MATSKKRKRKTSSAFPTVDDLTLVLSAQVADLRERLDNTRAALRSMTKTFEREWCGVEQQAVIRTAKAVLDHDDERD